MRIEKIPGSFKRFGRQLIVGIIIVSLGAVSVNAQPRWVPPGKVVRKLPANHRVVHVGRARYHYHGGSFYVHKPTGYHPVRAPLGAVVASLPLAAHAILLGGISYWVFNEIYYRRVPEGYVVVERPAEAEVAAPAETPQPENATHEVVVQAERLNVRSGPGLEFPVSGLVTRHAVLSVRGTAPGWLYVETDDGRFGWVMGKFTAARQVKAEG